ncbi:MAG: hypothetical protein QNJ00_11080 [Woeseiaceae bacterium]|nr:hypothetical protein [Woeseiaceae bacterium]
MDDIVDDEVLPYLSLAVDGLTTPVEQRHGEMELRPEDVAANEPEAVSTEIPSVDLGTTQKLEVHGWESSIWRRIKGYIGL